MTQGNETYVGKRPAISGNNVHNSLSKNNKNLFKVVRSPRMIPSKFAFGDDVFNIPETLESILEQE